MIGRNVGSFGASLKLWRYIESPVEYRRHFERRILDGWVLLVTNDLREEPSFGAWLNALPNDGWKVSENHSLGTEGLVLLLEPAEDPK